MEPTRVLVRVQECDLLLVRLNKQLDEMPEKRSILQTRHKIAEILNLQKRTDAAVRSLDAAIGRLEDEIQSVGSKIDAEQARLLSGDVKSPKELQSISIELDALKRRIDQLEGEMLVEMQKRETALEQSAKVTAALDAGAKTEASLTDRFKARGGDLMTQIENTTKQRRELLGQLPPDLSARYEALRAAKHGIAVGVLTEDMCTACRVSLPAGRVQVLLDGPDVSVCPSCNRILIVRDGAEV
jgi:uncharacterized protein